MRKILGFVLIAFLFFSCYHENQKEIVVPEKLLSEDELVEVLTDLQLAEGLITYQRLQKISVKKDFKDSVYNLVFENYGLTIPELTSNLNYYNNDPQNMEILYEKVLSNLSKLQSEVEVAAKKDTVNIVVEEEE